MGNKLFNPRSLFMIKAIIYDLDNVIVNSSPLHVRALEAVLNQYGITYNDLPFEDRARFVGMRVGDVIKEVTEKFNLKREAEIINQERRAIFLDLVNKELALMPGLIRSLDLFKKKFKIGLATLGKRSYVNLVFDKFNLSEYFNVTVAGDEVVKAKPDPEIYLVAAAKLGLQPNQCLAIEDATLGIESAKNADCKCLAVASPYTPAQDLSKADLVLKSLEEISEDFIKSLSVKFYD